MVKIIYTEDTITLMANKGKIDIVQQLAKIGQFKETQTGYRYIVIENKTETNE